MFIPGRGKVAQRRMPPLGVVEALHEFDDGRFCQGLLDKRCTSVRLRRPADDHPAPCIQDDSHVRPSSSRPHLRDVGDPESVGRVHMEVPVHKVGR